MTDLPESRPDLHPVRLRPRKGQESSLQRFFRRMRRNRMWLLLYLWTALLVPELVLRITAGSRFFGSGLLLAPLFGLVPALVCFLVCTSLPSKGANYAIAICFSAFFLLLAGFQLVYHAVFGSFCSVCSMVSGMEALLSAGALPAVLGRNLLPLLVMALPLTLLVLFGRRVFSFRPLKNPRGHLPAVAACVLIQLLTVLSLPLFGGTGGTSPYGLYHNSSDACLSVSRLGLFTAFRLDLTRFLTGKDASGTIIAENPKPETEFFPAETRLPAVSIQPILPAGRNELDIDFEALAAREENSRIAEVHEYFASCQPSGKNEKSGLFRGCNLILITAESFSDLIVSQGLTPTLYRMMQEGFRFTNYYVPDWSVSATDGEYAFLTGTIPKSGEWSFDASVGNLMPLTMAQQLICSGYSAYAYYGHTYDYCGRDRYLENLGYEYQAAGYGLDMTKQWPASDVEMVDLSTEDYVNYTPFTVYYMTGSGHREYNFTDNAMSIQNRSAVETLPYSEPVRAYLACQMELEKAMELLLERLEAAGVLDDTVIVLTANHSPSGLTPEQLGELAGYTPENEFELAKNGCIIWKSGIQPETIESPASHLDLLPTLSNLFGLEFDSRLYMGRDVFSSERPLVCLRDRSWITDKAMYNADTGEVINLTDEAVNDVYIETIHNEVYNRFTVSARILEYDYWRILFG